ncbi:MAG: Spy/CpxP family protein refolding chaperone [Caulobacteraceae bacterium]
MKAFLRLTAVAASAGALLISASASSAQAPPQQQMGSQGPDMHTLLHIRPDQEAGFRAYEQGLIPPAGIIATMRASRQKALSMTTPQRLDLQAQNIQLSQTIFSHQADAIRKFYAMLSPEQKRTYDQLTLPQTNSRGPQR